MRRVQYTENLKLSQIEDESLPWWYGTLNEDNRKIEDAVSKIDNEINNEETGINAKVNELDEELNDEETGISAKVNELDDEINNEETGINAQIVTINSGLSDAFEEISELEKEAVGIQEPNYGNTIETEYITLSSATKKYRSFRDGSGNYYISFFCYGTMNFDPASQASRVKFHLKDVFNAKVIRTDPEIVGYMYCYYNSINVPFNVIPRYDTRDLTFQVWEGMSGLGGGNYTGRMYLPQIFIPRAFFEARPAVNP